MVIKKLQASFESFGGGKIWDYPMPDETLGISYQEHNGRVPITGWGMNTVCAEEYYVISGSAEVHIDEEVFMIDAGDVVVLPVDSKSYLIANNLKLLTITRPNWYTGQYKEVV